LTEVRNRLPLRRTASPTGSPSGC